jgi:hypothetical protein
VRIRGPYDFTNARLVHLSCENVTTNLTTSRLQAWPNQQDPLTISSCSDWLPTSKAWTRVWWILGRWQIIWWCVLSKANWNNPFIFHYLFPRGHGYSVYLGRSKLASLYEWLNRQGIVFDRRPSAPSRSSLRWYITPNVFWIGKANMKLTTHTRWFLKGWRIDEYLSQLHYQKNENIIRDLDDTRSFTAAPAASTDGLTRPVETKEGESWKLHPTSRSMG